MFAKLIEIGWRGGRIGVGEAQAGDDHGFWPGEAPTMARATPGRQAEFAAGRAAARAALRGLGLVPFAIPMGADRAPVWPSGVVGSITHHGGQCLAVVARRMSFGGLGIDLEPLDPLPGELIPEILTPDEVRWLAEQPADQRGMLARIVFSAKESTYKALYPQMREVAGFDAMEIRPDPGAGRFRARLLRSFGAVPAGRALEGRVLCASGHVVTLMGLPAVGECGRNVTPIAQTEMECFHAIRG